MSVIPFAANPANSAISHGAPSRIDKTMMRKTEAIAVFCNSEL